MSKITYPFLALLTFATLVSCNKYKSAETSNLAELTAYFSSEGIEIDSIGADSTEIIISNFAGPDLVPSPSCLTVASTGEVFV